MALTPIIRDPRPGPSTARPLHKEPVSFRTRRGVENNYHARAGGLCARLTWTENTARKMAPTFSGSVKFHKTPPLAVALTQPFNQQLKRMQLSPRQQKAA